MAERVEMNERLLELTPETPLPYYNIAHGSSSQQDPRYTQPPPSLYSLAAPTPPAHQQTVHSQAPPPQQQQPMSYDLRIRTHQQTAHSEAPPLLPPPSQQQQMSCDPQFQPRLSGLTEEIHQVPLTGPQQFSSLDLLTCLVTVACLCFCPFGLCAVILAARARRRAARAESNDMELFVAGILSCLSIVNGVMIVLGLLVWAISVTGILVTS